MATRQRTSSSAEVAYLAIGTSLPSASDELTSLSQIDSAAVTDVCLEQYDASASMLKWVTLGCIGYVRRASRQRKHA